MTPALLSLLWTAWGFGAVTGAAAVWLAGLLRNRKGDSEP